MKQILFIILSFICTTIICAQECSIPVDGKYRTEYDERFKMNRPFDFEIKDGQLFFLRDVVMEQYEIKQLSECWFSLEPKEKIDETTLSELQKLLMKQKPFYDIIKVEGNVYTFVLRVDMHIIRHSGKFIRIAD